MGYYSPPTAYQDDPSILLIGQDFEGHWIVQENHGLAEGCFTTREAAVRYAEAERAHFPGALVVLTPAKLSMAYGHGA